jgi:hypothetical protein
VPAGLYGECAGLYIIARKVRTEWPFGEGEFPTEGGRPANTEPSSDRPCPCQTDAVWEPPARRETCVYMDVGAHNGDTYRSFVGEENSKSEIFADLPRTHDRAKNA